MEAVDRALDVAGEGDGKVRGQTGSWGPWKKTQKQDPAAAPPIRHGLTFYAPLFLGDRSAYKPLHNKKTGEHAWAVIGPEVEK